jgi:hypothetical protein
MVIGHVETVQPKLEHLARHQLVGVAQHLLYRPARDATGILDARQALFLDHRDDLPLPQHGRRGVVPVVDTQIVSVIVSCFIFSATRYASPLRTSTAMFQHHQRRIGAIRNSTSSTAASG